MEVSDMRNLTGIIPEPLTQLTSTTSLVGYPRQSPRSWGMTILEEDDSESSNNDAGDQGRSNKKQRLYKSQMPWFNKDKRLRKSIANPSCIKTKDTLNIFQRDLAAIKR